MANGGIGVVNMPSSYPLLMPLLLPRKRDIGLVEGLKGEKKSHYRREMQRAKGLLCNQSRI